MQDTSPARLIARGTKEDDWQRAVMEHQIWMQMLTLLTLMQVCF